MNRQLYTVVDIGCLECSNPSTLVAVNVDRQAAIEAADRYAAASGHYRPGQLTFADEIEHELRWGGQGMLVAFTNPTPQENP